MAETTPRTIRVSDELWTKAGQLARDEGTTRTALIIGWLEEYVREDKTVTTELTSIMKQIKAVRHRLIPDGEPE